MVCRVAEADAATLQFNFQSFHWAGLTERNRVQRIAAKENNSTAGVVRVEANPRRDFRINGANYCKG